MIYRPHIIEHHKRGAMRIKRAALLASQALLFGNHTTKFAHPERYRYL